MSRRRRTRRRWSSARAPGNVKPVFASWRCRHPRAPSQSAGRAERAARLRVTFSLRLCVELGDVIPIDEMIDERLEVVGPPVAIVDVVGVLPHVAAEDRRRALHQWALAVRSLGDDDLAILDGEPAPAGAELRDAGLDDVLLHLGDRAEVGDDLLLECAGNLVTATVRLHPLPEMHVVVVLAGIVEQAGILAVRPLDDLLQRLAFPFAALEQI